MFHSVLVRTVEKNMELKVYLFLPVIMFNIMAVWHKKAFKTQVTRYNGYNCRGFCIVSESDKAFTELLCKCCDLSIMLVLTASFSCEKKEMHLFTRVVGDESKIYYM